MFRVPLRNVSAEKEQRSPMVRKEVLPVSHLLNATVFPVVMLESRRRDGRGSTTRENGPCDCKLQNQTHFEVSDRVIVKGEE